MKHEIYIEYEGGKGLIITDLKCPYEGAIRDLKDEYEKSIAPSSQPYMVVMRKIVHDLKKILEGES